MKDYTMKTRKPMQMGGNTQMVMSAYGMNPTAMQPKQQPQMMSCGGKAHKKSYGGKIKK